MKILSLCSGYGGLDMAVEQHFSAKTAYWSDIDKTACDVMTARFPDALPIGDLTTLDLTMIHADVVTAGYPCQPFSTAGNRLGEKDERHLWPYIRHTISVLRPRFVVLENVAGHLSMGAAAVVGDLAALGYDAKWTVISAHPAPHRRKRWFCVATDAEGAEWRSPKHEHMGTTVGSATKSGERSRVATNTDRVTTWWDSGTLLGEKEPGRGDPNQGHGSKDGVTTTWGQYGPAIDRWERVLGRPAPEPVTDGKLSPLFVEWMMGLEEGHVTDVAASRAKALACLGNGVVPHQAKRALELLT